MGCKSIACERICFNSPLFEPSKGVSKTCILSCFLSIDNTKVGIYINETKSFMTIFRSTYPPPSQKSGHFLGKFRTSYLSLLTEKIDTKMKQYLISIALLLALLTTAKAQIKSDGGIEFDKTVHNFGDILLDSGPVSCTFTLTNNGSKPVVIYNVSTTCGCTDVEWTREPIRPGSNGTIKVTYSNDEGAYPFDKSITVYLSDTKKPIILKLRGVSNERPRPLTELYPVQYGPLGMKSNMLKCGNLEQGGSKTEAVMVANLSSSPLNLTFTDLPPQLSFSLSQNPIPAESTAELTYTITADRSIWGKNTYSATPLCNGKSYKTKDGESTIGVWAFTKENFSSMTDEQRQKGPMPRFETSTFDFGKAKTGDEIHATFTFKNEGKSTFCVYKLDTDACCWSHSDIPAAAPGETVTFRVHIDTQTMKAGESLTIVTLTTNSPTRPIVNLFISGALE